MTSEGQTEIRVSNMGRVQVGAGAITAGRLKSTGYRQVVVGGKKYPVHTLVLRAHADPAPTPTHTCDHIDGNMVNNRIENLRWASPHEQAPRYGAEEAAEEPNTIANLPNEVWRTIVVPLQ